MMKNLENMRQLQLQLSKINIVVPNHGEGVPYEYQEIIPIGLPRTEFLAWSCLFATDKTDFETILKRCVLPFEDDRKTAEMDLDQALSNLVIRDLLDAQRLIDDHLDQGPRCKALLEKIARENAALEEERQETVASLEKQLKIMKNKKITVTGGEKK